MALSLVVTPFDDPTVAGPTAASLVELAAPYGGRPGSGAPPQADERSICLELVLEG